MPPTPNVIIMYADDLGFGDVGCYGASERLPTPNLDRLAGEGIRFHQGYATASTCTPSRYSLLTGRYAWRTRLKKESFIAVNFIRVFIFLFNPKEI